MKTSRHCPKHICEGDHMAMAGVKMRRVFLVSSLQLVLILIIFPQFPCTTDAYSDGNLSLFSSINISTTWKNSEINISSLEIRSSGLPDWVNTIRPILCAYDHSRSYTAFFLGFFSNVSSSSSDIPAIEPSHSSNFYLAVFMLHPRATCVQSLQWVNVSTSSPRVFWSANRDKPVGENATLEFSAELGELVLKDADGSPVWSTINASTSGSDQLNYSGNAIRMEMTVEGNLVLIYGGNNRVIWQSFDHPTDTWLPNQRIPFGKNLTARISPSNLSPKNSYIVQRAFIKVQDRHAEKKPESLVPKAESHRGRKKASSLVPVVLVTALFGGLVFAIFVAGICYGFRMRKNTDHDAEQESDDEVTEALTKFSFEELKTCTQNFQIKLGQGGFGSVFEGVLCDGNIVAVKRLDSAGQGRKEFLAEVNTIGKVDHFNLVKLIGYCGEKYNRLLVYEHMCNGSLDKWIFNQDRAKALSWEIRQKIIRGVARGLEYLHEECNKKIIHFDIKPQNILLDANFNPKISDFGLAKLIDRNQSLVLTRLKGTPGYLAPELFGGSNVSVKADVYSFGIVILETMCGRRNLDSSKSVPLVHILKTEVEENQLHDVLDQRNEDFLCHQEEAVKMIKIGIWCLQTYDRRPSMSMVVKALEGSNMEIITDIHSLTMTHTNNFVQVMNSDISAALEASILSGPR